MTEEIIAGGLAGFFTGGMVGAAIFVIIMIGTRDGIWPNVAASIILIFALAGCALGILESIFIGI